MSAAFEAGALIFRLQTVGAEVFQKDTKQADQAFEALGKQAETTTKKVEPLGKEVDKTSESAKKAKAPLDETSKSTKKVGDESAVAAPKVKQTAAEIEELKKKSEDAAKTVGKVALGIGAAFAAMTTVAVGKFAEFDVGMAGVSAATHAPQAELDALGAAAIEAGADTAYSAKEAADAETELSKAGITTSEILSGSLKGSLALAAAGQLGVARAAEIAATTLKQFNLQGKDTGHVADLLAAGAGKAQGSVDDLAGGLEYVGPVAAGLNVSLEETVGALALFAEKGQIGQKAGTGLRGVLQSMVAPSSIAAKTMKEYGIEVFDTQGKFIGMAGVAGQLEKAFGSLTDAERSAAMGRIFGNEQITAANILYQGGTKAVEKWTAAVDDSGFAADTASRLQDNLAGDIEKLGGSLDTALIQTGSVANDTLRDMVQIITGLIDWYGSLDEGVQGTALVLGVGTAAVLLLGGTMLLAVPKVAEFKLALATLNTTMRGTALAGGAVGIAITAAFLILGAYAKQQGDAKARVESLTASLDENTGAFTKNTREHVVNNLEASGVMKTAKLLGISLSDMADAALGEADALKRVNAKLAEHRDEQKQTGVSSSVVGSAFKSVEDAISGQEGELAKAKDSWADHKAAMEGSTDAADEAAPAYDELTDAVDGVVTSISDLAEELDALNGKNLDAREAARQLEAAYDDFDETLKKNGASLNELGTDFDLTSEKGRENQAALDGIAQAALDSGQAIIDAGGGYDDYRASLESSREALLTRISDLGITGEAAQTLADKILDIPSETEWTAIVDTADAKAKLAETEATAARIKDLLSGVGATMGSHIANGNGGGGITQADGGKVNFYANGGRENHVAQFARAGTMRVWAEPETGGEWYIPASPAKRARSTQLLAQAANEFGYQLVASGAQAFADGGRDGGTAAVSAGETHNHFSFPITQQPGESESALVDRLWIYIQKKMR